MDCRTNRGVAGVCLETELGIRRAYRSGGNVGLLEWVRNETEGCGQSELLALLPAVRRLERWLSLQVAVSGSDD